MPETSNDSLSAYECTPGCEECRTIHQAQQRFREERLRQETATRWSFGEDTQDVEEPLDPPRRAPRVRVPEPGSADITICEHCYRDALPGEHPPRCGRHVGMTLCPHCGGLHYTERGEEPCVTCGLCEEGRERGYHIGPVCCAPVPEPGNLVHCDQCDGQHQEPACGLSLDIDTGRCGRCWSCTRMERDRQRRERNRAYSISEYSGSGRVFNYSFVPEPLVFRGDGPFFYGMELELEVNDLRSSVSNAAEIATKSLGRLGYLKEDGSIDYGFEIVSTPMSYLYFMEHYPWGVLSELREHGCRTNRGTGIHVHVSKAGFTPVHAYKWMKFWYRNRNPLEVFARREGSRWAEFSQDERRRVKYYAKGDMRTGSRGEPTYGPIRYSAINVLPPNTYEVRIFRSSLSPRVARATLGLVAASVDYTREITPRDIAHNGAWEWGKFTKWVRKQGGKYPDLLGEITRATQRLEQLSAVR